MFLGYNDNHYSYNPKNNIFYMRSSADTCWRLYYLYQNIEDLFYDHPELEEDVHDVWEEFKEHLQKVVDYADELYVEGNDPAPKRIPLGGPPYCLGYILRVYIKWHTDFLIDDMEDAKEWFEDLTGGEPEYEEFKEALTHYKRAFKRLSDLCL